MSDESDFEEISFGDAVSTVEKEKEQDPDNEEEEEEEDASLLGESVVVEINNKHQHPEVRSSSSSSSSTPRVQVEIPPSLLPFQNHHPKGTNNEAKNQQASSDESQVSSLASSFVQLTSALAVQQQDSAAPITTTQRLPETRTNNDSSDDDEEQEERSNATSVYVRAQHLLRRDTNASPTTAEEWDEIKSLSSSVYSNFEFLNLEGNPVLRCRKCSFHNVKKAPWCAMCGIPLVANPCPGTCAYECVSAKAYSLL